MAYAYATLFLFDSRLDCLAAHPSPHEDVVQLKVTLFTILALIEQSIVKAELDYASYGRRVSEAIFIHEVFPVWSVDLAFSCNGF